jgi:cobalt-zinc-cadmium efflux system membrane fusion protein
MTFRFCFVLIFAVLIAGCGESMPEPAATEVASGDYERGPHRGRMLREGNFAIEVTIFETGVPPQYRLYAYRDNQPLPANGVQATVTLGRLGGKTDHFTFKPEGDVLIGDGVVLEPHSFDVTVVAREGEREHRWEYASYEGRTTIAAAVAESSGLKTERSGPATLRTQLPLMGSVVLNENRLARVRARFPGAVREVRVGVGDSVTRGQLLARVEANESLRSYEITAPISGVVTARNTNVGDVAGDAPLFEIADLSEVWVDLHAFGKDLPRLQPGQPVTLISSVGETRAEATLDRLLPIAAAGSQSAIARVHLPNPDGVWRPGLAVSADVTVGERAVPLAVRTSGLQPFRDFTVVYAQVGETYEVRMLELGERDPDYAEVLGGIDPDVTYVTEQSFLIRADIEKSGASHDH